MSAEDAWQIILWGTQIIVTTPLVGLALQSVNPFLDFLPKGVLFKYDHARHKNANHKRNYPISVASWVWYLAWLITGICITISTVKAFDNTGGWAGNFLRPFCSVVLAFLSTVWMPYYFSPCSSCTNIVFIQGIALCMSVITLAVYLSTYSHGLNFFLIAPIIWNGLTLVKVYFEGQYGCEWKPWPEDGNCPPDKEL